MQSHYSEPIGSKRKHYDAEAEALAGEFDCWKRPRAARPDTGSSGYPSTAAAAYPPTSSDTDDDMVMEVGYGHASATVNQRQQQPYYSLTSVGTHSTSYPAAPTAGPAAAQGMYQQWQDRTRSGQNGYGIRPSGDYKEWRKSSQTVVETRELQKNAKRDMVRMWNTAGNQQPG